MILPVPRVFRVSREQTRLFPGIGDSITDVNFCLIIEVAEVFQRYENIASILELKTGHVLVQII